MPIFILGLYLQALMFKERIILSMLSLAAAPCSHVLKASVSLRPPYQKAQSALTCQLAVNTHTQKTGLGLY